MEGPAIVQIEEDERNERRYTLVVPNVWMRQRRWPRLTLWLWLCRLAWRAKAT